MATQMQTQQTPPGSSRPPARRTRRLDVLRLALIALSVELFGMTLAPVWGGSYDLRGALFLGLLTLLTVTLDIAIALAWNRWPAPLRLLGRVVSMLLISCAGALVAFVYLNKQEGFYASFTDIWGSAQQKTVVTHYAPDQAHARLDVLNTRWQPGARAAARRGDGTVLTVQLFGSRSGIDRGGYIYLPAAYFSGSPSLRFPVVELFPGQPGSPQSYFSQLGLTALLNREIAAHRIPPVIAVVATVTQHAVFSECVNAVHGPQNETYLTHDVVDDVNATFRTLGGRTWAVGGYSTGGFCAVNVASHHPDRYAAAASLSGYFEPAQDPNTAQLYAHSKTALRRNSPDYWVSHASPVAPPLYIFASGQDPFAVRQFDTFQRLVHKHAPLLPVEFAMLPSGGHNFNVWRAGLPKALEYLSTYLPMPLSR